MKMQTRNAVQQICDVSEAQEVIAELLVQFMSKAAYERMLESARQSHKTVEQQAHRVSGNLLSSFVVNKPGGFIWG